MTRYSTVLAFVVKPVVCGKNFGVIVVPTADAINSVTEDYLKQEHAKRFRPDRALLVEASLGQRSAERSFATGTLSASVEPVSRLTLRADLGFNARATDTAPLAVAGRQQEARLGADLRGGRLAVAEQRAQARSGQRLVIDQQNSELLHAGISSLT